MRTHEITGTCVSETVNDDYCRTQSREAISFAQASVIKRTHEDLRPDSFRGPSDSKGQSTQPRGGQEVNKKATGAKKSATKGSTRVQQESNKGATGGQPEFKKRSKRGQRRGQGPMRNYKSSMRRQGKTRKQTSSARGGGENKKSN